METHCFHYEMSSVKVKFPFLSLQVSSAALAGLLLWRGFAEIVSACFRAALEWMAATLEAKVLILSVFF